MRAELVLAGCILVVIGFALSAEGYAEIQPTFLERTTTYLAQLAGTKTPPSSPKTAGYVLLGAGGATLILGLGLILRSRPSED